MKNCNFKININWIRHLLPVFLLVICQTTSGNVFCGAVFSQKPLTTLTFENLPYDTMETEKVRKLINQYWGKTIAQILIDKTTNYLGKKYLSLLLDPGVATRLNQLVYHKYLKYPFKDLSPTELRESFKIKLGNRLVYRGMYLTPMELDNIIKFGIESDYLRKFGNLPDLFASEFNPIEDIYTRVSGYGSYDYIDFYPSSISTSENKVVAAGIPASFHRINPNNKYHRELYIFELEVPVITLIERSKLFEPPWSPAIHKTWYYFHGHKLINAADKKFEQWIFFSIPPSQIKSREKVDDTNYNSFSLGSP